MNTLLQKQISGNNIMICKNYTVGPFKSFVINNKAFRNLYCNPQKSFHTSPTRIIEAVNHFSNSTIAFIKKKLHLAVIFSSKCYCWVWRMVDSLYYSSRKIPEKCENSFVNYRINHQELYYLMRQITKDLNSANEWFHLLGLFSWMKTRGRIRELSWYLIIVYRSLRRAHIVAADNRRKVTNVKIAKLWRQATAKRGISKIRWRVETTFNGNTTARDEWLRQGTESSEQNRRLSGRWVTMSRRSPTTRDEVRRLAADWLAVRNDSWRWVAVTMTWLNGRHKSLCVCGSFE